MVSLPSGIPHTFQVESETARMLTVAAGRKTAPSFDRFVSDARCPHRRCPDPRTGRDRPGTCRSRVCRSRHRGARPAACTARLTSLRSFLRRDLVAPVVRVSCSHGSNRGALSIVWCEESRAGGVAGQTDVREVSRRHAVVGRCNRQRLRTGSRHVAPRARRPVGSMVWPVQDGRPDPREAGC